MATLAGRFTITVNGSPLESMPGATLTLGGVGQVPVVTDQLVVHSMDEEPAAAMVKGTIPMTPGLDIEGLRALRDATIGFFANNGTSYSVTSGCAHQSSGWELSKDGLPVEFFGSAAKPS